jgi:two-component system cell cycle sensor histidine kinase PleC
LKLALLPEEPANLQALLSPDVRAALDCLRVAVTIFDSRERLIYCSQHFNYIFRALPDRASLLGKTYEELVRMELAWGEIGADSISGGPDAFVAQRRAQFKAGEYAPFDIELVDGRIIEIKARCIPDGGWIVLWGDATHSRHLMRRLETAVDLSADAFAFWDSGDRLVICNEMFAELHGFGAPDQMAGKTFRELTAVAVKRARFVTGDDALHWIERRLDAHGAPAGALTVMTPAGAAYLVRERATRDGGRATVFTDITERHRVENALAEQSDTLERTRHALIDTQTEARKQAMYLADVTRRLGAAEAEADTAKTALLRTMSHELKTPLNAILGFSDLLRMSADRFSVEQIGEYAGLIHLAGGNLLKLINQILDLTKIAAGRFPLRKRELPVGGALWAAADAQSQRAAEKSIRIEIAGCEGDLVIEADESALNNMIGQLVENAVTFTQNGGEVRVSALRGDGVVRITIADNGPGVPADDMARIQEPFEQFGRGTADHVNGAGLGLPLVKGLAEIHGGFLLIDSVDGQGFTATLQLPAI